MQVWLETLAAYVTVAVGVVQSVLVQMSDCITILGQEGIKFNPGFPGTCPYVTTVGATQMNANSTVYEPESACEQTAYSGGGFSNVFHMPSYQKDAVLGYLLEHPPPYSARQYNNSRMVLQIRPPFEPEFDAC